MTGGKLYAGDVGAQIFFPVDVATFDGNLALSVRLEALKPTGKRQRWPVTIHSKTTTLVMLRLVTDGADISDAGSYSTRAWVYGAGDVFLGASEWVADSVTVEAVPT